MTRMAPPVITFLSDYGLEDDFVGVCHAVIVGLCPDCHIIDLNHGIPRHNVQAGALVLSGALPYLPVGVHLAVVDPDVGAERRAVALRLANDHILVGPDNGVLSLAAELAGGVIEAVDIAHSEFRLEPVSATFHGRDIFAPVAARLAAGAALGQAGAPCDPDDLVRIELPRPAVDNGTLVAHAIYVDRFGNVQLDASHEDIARAGLKLGTTIQLHRDGREPRPAVFARTFAEVERGALLVYEDADRRMALAVSHANAAELLGLSAGEQLRIVVE
jgi:S-adenosyl-L-methionine hydrolase (adenosine-forming)